MTECISNDLQSKLPLAFSPEPSPDLFEDSDCSDIAAISLSSRFHLIDPSSRIRSSLNIFLISGLGSARSLPMTNGYALSITLKSGSSALAVPSREPSALITSA
uniref:Uncharacterized protein n=1 Tax=Arundo donax TaxID=35708 RepID=A0A0A9CLH4_ARUDO